MSMQVLEEPGTVVRLPTEFAQSVSQAECRSRLYVCRHARHLVISLVSLSHNKVRWQGEELTSNPGLGAETVLANVKSTCRSIIGWRRVFGRWWLT